MRKMRTLFLVLLCCGLSLYAGVSYVKAEEKVPSDYDAYLQETGMPENEIQKLDEHVKQFIVDDLKNGDGKFEYMKIDVGKQAMNGREEDFEWIEFYASVLALKRSFIAQSTRTISYTLTASPMSTVGWTRPTSRNEHGRQCSAVDRGRGRPCDLDPLPRGVGRLTMRRSRL